jgi:hypothetical protein
VRISSNIVLGSPRIGTRVGFALCEAAALVILFII